MAAPIRPAQNRIATAPAPQAGATRPPVIMPAAPEMKPLEAQAYVLKPPSILLLGDVSSGKTDSLISFLEIPGKELFVVVTEPTGVETLLDSVKRRQRISGMSDMLDRLHFKLIRPAKPAISTLYSQAVIANSHTADAMQQLQGPSLNKKAYTQYIDLIRCLADFRCDRTGQLYGDVTTWDDNRMLAIDSLSGLNHMVQKTVAGNRLSVTQPEIQIIQNAIHELITTLIGLDCYFALTAHVEWEKDELLMKTRVMASTIGRRLAPKIPINFSEAVRTRRDQDKFLWSTDEPDTTVKWRALPRSDDLPADFKQLVKAYEARKLFAKEVIVQEQ